LRSGNADLNITTGAGVTIPGATTSLAGLMSAADKQKVNNLTGVYVPVASGVNITNNVSAPGTKITVSTGPTMMTDGNGNGSFSIVATGAIDLTVVGAAGGNCLDSGALGANSVYHIFQIANGTTVAFLASLSPTNPTLPSGYTQFVRLGAMITDGVPNLYRTQQLGRDAFYVITAATNTAGYPSKSGASGASSWALKGSPPLVPATAAAAKIAATATGTVSNLGIGSNAAEAAIGVRNLTAQSTGTYTANSGDHGVSFTDTNLYFNAGAAAWNAFLIGWTDTVNALS
jgi:hypothetical protein